jgi:serine/threonine protein kinase
MERRRTAEGTAAEALRREAGLLRQVRHPGIVEVVDLVEDAAQTVLVTTSPAGPPLAEVDLTEAEVAGVVAVLATTVADLHDLGVAHGAIDLACVGLDPSGRPVLDGFARATCLSGSPGRWPTTPAAREDAEALGRLAVALLSKHGATRGALGQVVEPLAGGRDRPRLTARRLADLIVARVPDARLPGEGDDVAALSPPASAPRPRLATALAVVVTIATAIALAAHHHPGRPRPTPTVAAAGPDATTTTSPPPVYVGDEVNVGPNRYRVGEPTDVMALGRWACGQSLLVIARPRTGQIWMFRQFAHGPQPVEAVEVGDVPGLRGVRAEPAGTCDWLLVDRPIGPVRLDLTTVR